MRSTAITAVLLGLVAVAAPPARAAYLSEIFIDDGRGEQGMPNGLELNSLDRVAADGVDLIVIDARPGGLGMVKRVITVPTDKPLLLVSDRTWPSDLWGAGTKLGEDRTTLDALDHDGDFQFSLARSVLLYDRPTRVLEGTLESLFSEAQQARLDGAELLDAVSFTLGDSVLHADAPGQRFAFDAGHAAIRLAGGPDARAAAGHVTDVGTLEGMDPAPQLTPGLLNPNWTTAPEPAAATLWLAAMTALLGARPAGRCSGGGKRLS